MKIKILFVIAFALFFVGCMSPHEEAVSLVEDGYKTLKDGNVLKAVDKFKQALQIEDKNIDALWGLTLAYEKLGDYKHMFELCKQVAIMQPSNVPANLKLANLYLLVSDRKSVDQQLVILNKHGKNNPDVIAFKAEVALKYNQLVEANQLALEALKLDKNNSFAFMTLAKIAGRSGDYPQAISYIDEAILVNPNNVSLYLAKLSLHQDSHAINEIPDIYKKLIAINPQNFEFKRNLALFYVSNSEYQQAETLLNEVLKKFPENIDTQIGLVKLYYKTRGKQASLSLLDKFNKALPNNTALMFASYDVLEQIGEYERSRATIKAIIENAKDLDSKLQAMALLADDLLDRGYREEAEKLIAQVLFKDAKNKNGLLIKAKFNMFDLDFNAAISVYRNVLDDYPNDILSMIGLGQAYRSSGAIELANEIFYQAYKLGGNASEIKEGYIEFLLKYNKAKRAIELLEDASRSAPGDVLLLKQLVQIKSLNGDAKGANDIIDNLMLNSVTAPIAYQLKAEVFEKNKQIDVAIQAYKMAFKLDSKQISTVSNIVRLYNKNNTPQDALNFLNEILSNEPNNYDYVLLNAVTLAKLGNGKGIENLESLVKNVPKREEAYVELAKAYMARNDIQSAERLLSEANKQLPDGISIKTTLAECKMKLKAFDQAIKIYEDLVEKYPSEVFFRNNLAGLLLDFSNNEKDLNRAHHLTQTFVNADLPVLKDTVAWSMFKQGKYEIATKKIKEAIEELPGQLIFYYHAYQIYTQTGQTKLAADALLKASKLPLDDLAYIPAPLEKLLKLQK